MAVVFVKSGETIDSALRRFSSMINKEGILFELKKRAYFEKPSEKKKKKLSIKSYGRTTPGSVLVLKSERPVTTNPFL